MKFKKLYRLYINSLLKENTTVNLTKEQTNYLINVLRVKNNNQIRVFNETDGEYLATISYIPNKKLILNIISQIRQAQLDSHYLTLAQCIIKPDRMVRVIDMATQIGVTDIIPIISEYSQYQKLNLEKYYKYIIEACEQSERITIPNLLSTKTLENFLVNNNLDCIIYANEQEKEQQIEKITVSTISKTAVLIGPEGGFSPKDRFLLEKCDKVISISLGKNILRSETAAACTLAQLQLLKNM